MPNNFASSSKDQPTSSTGTKLKRPTTSSYTNSTKLTPNKFGLFTTPTATMQVDNSAGEMMDDLDARAATINDLHYSQSAGPSLATALIHENEAGKIRDETPTWFSDTEQVLFPRHPYQSNQRTVHHISEELMPEAAGEMGGGGGLRSGRQVAMMTPSNGEEDGDVEDNTSEPEPEVDESGKKGTRDLRSKEKPNPANTSQVVVVKKDQPAKRSYGFRRTVLKPAAAGSSDASTPRRSLRQSSIATDRDRWQKKASTARSPVTRAKQIAASNRSMMTARAVTLREKARKVDKAAVEGEYFRAVYGRGKRNTNPEAAANRKVRRMSGVTTPSEKD